MSTRIKFLKHAAKYSLNGLGGEIIECVEGNIMEIPDHHSAGIIRSGYAELTDEPLPEEVDENDDNNDDDETDLFGLNEENKAYIKAHDKGSIEGLMRGYGIEIDKRQNMASIQKTMVDTVAQALPDSVESTDDLAAFYFDNFQVQLDLESYPSNDVTKMAADMGAVLAEALKL